MQETRNNCFGFKIRSTTRRQAKTGKNECRNITATAHVLICFRLMKDHSFESNARRLLYQQNVELHHSQQTNVDYTDD